MNDRRPLRIIHTESSLGWGGQEIRILTEAEGMRARGHVLEIWAAPGSNILPEAQKRGLTTRALPIARKTVHGVLALRRALCESRPDVINTHSSTDAWLVALARLTLRDAPPVVRTRHISAPVPKNTPTHWLYMHATRHVVTTGERLRETLIRDNGFRPQRITSVPTGIDLARFRPGDKLAARRALGLDPGLRYIGIVATLRSWKGHLYLLDAFADLRKDHADLRLLIVGDGPMRSVLEARITALGLGADVRMAGRQDEPVRWFQALDVFCLPSYANEGVPQALLQAMACGLAIVTTPVGAIPEAVVDGRDAILVAPRDATALAQGLRRAVGDQKLAARLGASAMSEVTSRFALDGTVKRMEHILADLVEHHRRRRRGARAQLRRWRASLSRRWRETRLPRGYRRLGTRYGGWWLDAAALSREPLLIDCGLGRDISFPSEFITRFSGRVIGIDPNPDSLAYCRAHQPPGMELWDRAFWTRAGENLTFHLPRPQEDLPLGADGISGSLLDSHGYVAGGRRISVTTTSLEDVLATVGRKECDVLKLDVEGAEYPLLDALCANGGIARVRQLLVEFHHGATHYTPRDTEARVEQVKRCGFDLVHVESRNYIFRRRELG